MCKNSAKSNPSPGVAGYGFRPPGVVIIEEGRSNLLFVLLAPGLLFAPLFVAVEGFAFRCFAFGGGVEGGSMRDAAAAMLFRECVVRKGTAGEGDVARYNNKSAPSSPVVESVGPAVLVVGVRTSGIVGRVGALSFLWRCRARERMGGVRGGEARREECKEPPAWKECSGRSSSSSSSSSEAPAAKLVGGRRSVLWREEE